MTVREAKPLETITAETIVLQSSNWPNLIRCQGNLVADEVSVVSAKIPGRVKTTLVDLGQRVVFGEPLVMIDDTEFKMEVAQSSALLSQARVAIGLRDGDSLAKLDPQKSPPMREAKAVLEEAQAKRKRWEQLRDQNAAAADEYEQIISAESVAEARLTSALNSVSEKIAVVHVRQTELDLATERLAETTVTAPFDGIVQDRQVATGSYVQTGQPLLTIVRVNPLRFRGTAPERIAQSLAVGQSIRLTIESLAEPRAAKVSRISPTLDARSRSLMFEAIVENPDQSLRAGLFTEAVVTLDQSIEAITAPRTALFEFAGAEKVWQVIEGVAHEQRVKTGRRSATDVEIIEGVTAGDMILVDAAKGRVARIDEAESTSKTAANHLTRER